MVLNHFETLPNPGDNEVYKKRQREKGKTDFEGNVHTTLQTVTGCTEVPKQGIRMFREKKENNLMKNNQKCKRDGRIQTTRIGYFKSKVYDTKSLDFRDEPRKTQTKK